MFKNKATYAYNQHYQDSCCAGKYLPHLQNFSLILCCISSHLISCIFFTLSVYYDGILVYTGQCYYTYHFSWWPRRPLGSLKRESEKCESSEKHILKKHKNKAKQQTWSPFSPLGPAGPELP